MKPVIGAHHEFHDEEFVAGWADRFVPTPERLELFNVILSELRSSIPKDGRVVELGIGPGYLAEHLLNAMPGINYYGIDFSSPMIEIARQRLGPHSARLDFVQADLVKEAWWAGVTAPINAIISTWALHDLGSQENVERVYKICAQALKDDGIFLNGDFIKPDKAIYEYESGRFEIAKHLEILNRAGFKNAECLVVLEKEIESPTAAQNYACFKGII
jgi:SAM-dependent methyltransferase